MISAEKIRSLGKDKILDMLNNPPSLKENTPEVYLYIDLCSIYYRYCVDANHGFVHFEGTEYEDRVNNPRKHAAEFVERLLNGEFGV